MIANIIDRRTQPYRWNFVDVIIEPTWHDNSHNGDQAQRDDSEPGYATKKKISLAHAIAWAMTFPVPMTLYIYDKDSDVVIPL